MIKGSGKCRARAGAAARLGTDKAHAAFYGHCLNCGAYGHTRAQSCKPGGGASIDGGSGNAKGKGKGKGKTQRRRDVGEVSLEPGAAQGSGPSGSPTSGRATCMGLSAQSEAWVLCVDSEGTTKGEGRGASTARRVATLAAAGL